MVFGSYLAATAAVAAVALILVGFFAARRAFRAWAVYRGPQVITCPETGKAAGVSIDTGRAERTAFLGGEPQLRLASCTRWPEKAGCGQECLAQIESAPGECSVRFKLEQWYRGKACIYCRKKFDAIHWHDHKPALVSAEGKFVDWVELPLEELQVILDTHFPVCWNCDTIERFRQQNPDLITDITGRDRASGVIR
jgi:hypothetical protein